jgi:transcriptional regulator with XRE-family HTH domain
MTLTVYGSYLELVQFTGLTKTSFHNWAFDGNAPRLENLLHLAKLFNMSVYDWLATPVDPYGLLRIRLNHLQSKRGPSPRFSAVKIGRKNNSIADIRVALLEKLNNPKPMSLNKSFIRIGFSITRAWEVAPDLCRKIEERYAKHCRDYKEMMHQKKLKLVREVIQELKAQNKHANPHIIANILQERGATCIWVLREIARAELKRLRLSATVA